MLKNKKQISRIDEYIAKAAFFAQDICNELRRIILTTDSNIIEDWKWGPNYSRNGMVCGFGAFSDHVTLTFFQGSRMKDTKKLFNYGAANAHNRSIKFTSSTQIPENDLREYIKEAIAINLSGEKEIHSLKGKNIAIPKALLDALEKEKLLTTFEQLTYTARKEYVLLIQTAKKDETRTRRLKKILEALKNNITA
jgi:uncharacterized protein YdeI (YjbR/CyaY-like superfamily)